MNVARLKIVPFLAILFIPLILFLFSSFVTTSGHSDLQLAVARKMDFDIRINTVGILDASRSHRVSSEIKGNKGKIIFLVEDGSWVEKNDVIVRFDPTPFESKVLSLSGEVKSHAAVVEAVEQSLEWEKTQADREVKVAEYQLQSCRLELTQIVNGDIPLQLAQLEGELEEARQSHTKHENFIAELEKMESKGMSNLTEIIQSRAKATQLKKLYEIARKKYISYKDYVVPSQIEKARTGVYRDEMELAQIKKGGQYKVARARAAVEKAKRELETAEEKLKQVQNELEKTTIRAPFTGIAVLYEGYRGTEKRLPRIGDTVWQNQPILYLPDVSSFVVKTKVREVDIHKVHKDQNVTIRIDAFPKTFFSGRVLSIGALAEKSPELGREKYFQLIVSVDENETPLRPGMTARVSILNKQIRETLSVPIQSIFSDGAAKFCYKFNGRDFEKTRVSILDQNEDFVSIESGLKEGDRVSLVEPASS